MKKTHKIVMLPTEKSKLYSLGKVLHIGDKEYTKFPNPTLDYKPIPFHLYILSDEEIKEGEHCYSDVDECIYQVSEYNSKTGIARELDEHPFILDGCKKVIATTNKSLLEYIQPTGTVKGSLPQILESFLPIYVKTYNEGNPITEVELEYEEYAVGSYGMSDGEPTIDTRLKLIYNNEVIIHLPEEKMYSKQDLLELTMGNSNIIDWIEENL